MNTQMSLFGGPDDVPEAAPSAPEAPPPAPEPPAPEPPEPPVHPAQIGLFGAAAAARVAVEELIAEARFGEALTKARELERSFGSFFAVPDAACLEPLAELDFASAGLPAIRDAWRRARDQARHSWRRQDLAAALVRKLPATGLELVGTDVVLLADVAELKRRSDRVDVERLLVRDALLAGMDLEPDVIVDEAVRNLLREDLEPEWLACLGVMLGVWPAPVVSEPIEDARTARERALAFCDCLSVAMRPAAHPPAAVIAARIRMRELNRDLHARHMGGG